MLPLTYNLYSINDVAGITTARIDKAESVELTYTKGYLLTRIDGNLRLARQLLNLWHGKANQKIVHHQDTV